MRNHRKGVWALAVVLASLALSGCAGGQEQRIIRIGHNQSTNHPSHIGLTAFQEYINDHLGHKYVVEVYPSELLGSQTDMVQLTQTGAIDFCIASNSILETFSENYSLFNLPYLFSSQEAYHAAMEDEELTDRIFESTKDAGFTTVTWLDAGTRNFYTINKPINSPADLKGLKIRVQQSPTNIEMMRLLGGSATPMGFGEVYTSLQSGIIDGAENNELALRDNGHGDICKYYSYDMHQMIPDLLIGNNAFLEDLSSEEREIFEDGFERLNEIQRREWTKGVEDSIENAVENQGVTFLYPDTEPFREAVLPLHGTLLSQIPEVQPVYEQIQRYNAEFSESKTGEMPEEERIILQENNKAEVLIPEDDRGELAEYVKTEWEGRL